MVNHSNTLALYEVATLLGAAPWLLVVTIGAIYCLRRLSSQPREGWLLLSAITLAIFARFAIPSLLNMGWSYISSAGLRGLWVVPLLYELPTAFMQAGAWSLIMLAAFGAERTARSKYLVENDDRDSP